VEAIAMGSLLEELARREAAARERIEELREQIAGLERRVEAEEERLSRLVIARETVEEILGDAAALAEEPVHVVGGPVGGAADARGGGEDGQRSVLGVVTVPPWELGTKVSVLPQAYRDAVEVLLDAGGAMRVGRVLGVMGVADSAAKREGLRSKLKRLVERGWLEQVEAGLFAVRQEVARDLAASAAGGPSRALSRSGTVSSPSG
jgi:hypothetical protein